jgi:cytochrome c oxidase subunit 2
MLHASARLLSQDGGEAFRAGEAFRDTVGWRERGAACFALLTAQACSGAQSSLAPAGPDARAIASLFWWMTAGSAVVWLLVMGLSFYAARHTPVREREQPRARAMVVWGGVILPTLLLTVLLVYGLGMLPPLLARAPRKDGEISVTGEQWWWRVRYLLPSGDHFELANELRIPRGRRVPVSLRAEDVIHSFWVPALTGKRDMIPGRATELALEAERIGTYLGACGEYCGASHAQMRFHVVVLEPAAYQAWLQQQQRPAQPAMGQLARVGESTFQRVGCGACHTVRGTAARGSVGPDLTHLGGRRGLAAAALPNDVAALQRWLAHPKALKPSARMPPYAALGRDELRALAGYLKGLQ